MSNDHIAESIVKSFMGGGWEGLLPSKPEDDTIEAKQKALEYSLKQYEEASDIAHAFSTKNGKMALERMRYRCIEPPIHDINTLGTVNSIAYGWYRDGQISIYKWIIACMEYAAKGPPTVDDLPKQ